MHKDKKWDECNKKDMNQKKKKWMKKKSKKK
jgi:hypothetical protein